ncbi:hypothetical protein IV102_16560 [bacterium]|nr:hypothetical protein [bacterium]
MILHEGAIVAVLPDLTTLQPARVHIQENQPGVKVIVGWIADLADVLDKLHESRRPRFLGQLPLGNVLVNADGKVQLAGFEVDRDFKLQFLPVDANAPRPEDTTTDARTDVWCLGSLLKQMVDLSDETVRKAYREEGDLHGRMRWKDGPKVDGGSLLTGNITVLTAEEKDPMAKTLRRWAAMLGLVIVVFLLVALLCQTLFPEGGEF